MKQRMARMAGLTLLLGWTLAWMGCAATGGSPPPPPPPNPTGMVATFLKDAAADNVMACRIDVTGATLTDAGNRTTILSGSLPSLEIRHLELAPSLLFLTSSATSGDYTTFNLTLANPQLTLTDAQGNITQANASSSPSVRLARSGLSLPLAVTVPNGGNVGVMIDFDLRNSLTLEANGNYLLDPVVKATLLNRSSTEKELEDALATITTIQSATNSLDLRLLSNDQTVLVRTDSNTQFASDIGSFANLRVGQTIEVDAQFQTDGTFLARYVDLGAPDLLRRYQGVVTRVRQDAQGNFSFDVVVQK